MDAVAAILTDEADDARAKESDGKTRELAFMDGTRRGYGFDEMAAKSS